MNTTSPTFGSLLRQLRKRASMTQGDLAAAVGYSVSFVSDLEQNRRLPAVAVVLQQFIPALGLQEEAGFATHLVELAALARGERLPATVTVQRTAQLTVTDTFTFPSSRLPIPPTALLGREQTVKMICDRLQGHAGRLLTLVGPPGVGKTRLALAVATQSEPLYQDGAYFVPLAALSDPALVAAELVATLPISDMSQRTPKVKLIEFLRRKALLLVLDNFEQITPAAGLVAELLTECPGVRILVTSRERLHLRAEQRYQVPPLVLAVAVELFTQRAQAVDFAFELNSEQQPVIEAICQRLDCLPLAIELIAARIDLFSPQTMLARLNDRGLDMLKDGASDTPVYQRTLRNAIYRSYALCNPEEQRLFRTLGVFVGGFDLAAVVDFGFTEATLQALVHKNLVKVETRAAYEPRFLLLETLRESAYEQLTASQTAQVVQHRHAIYYLQLVEAIRPNLRGPQAKVCLARLDTEHNNLRTALTWALATHNAEIALRLTGALGQFWRMRGYAYEEKQWLGKSLILRADGSLATQARALIEAGILDSMLGGNTYAQTFFEQSLSLYRELNDSQGIASAYLNLGRMFYETSAYEQARSFYQQSLVLYQQVEDQVGMADSYIALGWLAATQGDYEQATLYFGYGAEIQRKLDDSWGFAAASTGLAFVALHQQAYSEATKFYNEGLKQSRQLENKLGIATALNDLGRTALYQGNFVEAASYLTESFHLAQELGYPPLIELALANQGNLAFERGDYVQATQFYTQSLTIAQQINDKPAIATMFERLASTVGAQNKVKQATELLGAAANLRVMIGIPLLASDQPRYQQIITTARAQLDETIYTTAYAAGYAMTTDQAIAFALAQLGTLA